MLVIWVIRTVFLQRLEEVAKFVPPYGKNPPNLAQKALGCTCARCLAAAVRAPCKSADCTGRAMENLSALCHSARACTCQHCATASVRTVLRTGQLHGERVRAAATISYAARLGRNCDQQQLRRDARGVAHREPFPQEVVVQDEPLGMYLVSSRRPMRPDVQQPATHHEQGNERISHM